MKVIVAGFPKTGTKSMHSALEILGYSVYDALENTCLLGDEYAKISNEGWTTEDFKRMYENVDATMDFPACFFWEEISRAFPDAKIVLTMRDDGEEAWLRSFLKQMEMMSGSVFYRVLRILSPTMRKAHNSVKKLYSPCFNVNISTWLGGSPRFNKSLLKLAYRSHNAYVLQNAPKDKLLIFKCSEGWGPLCKFLGVPIPDEPFPHKNKAGSIMNDKEERNLPLVKKLQKEAVISVIGLSAVTAVSGICLYKFGVSGIFNAVRSYCPTWR